MTHHGVHAKKVTKSCHFCGWAKTKDMGGNKSADICYVEPITISIADRDYHICGKFNCERYGELGF